MTEPSSITYHRVAQSLLDNMISNIIRNQTTINYTNYLTVQKETASASNPELNKLADNLQYTDPNRDIFSQEKIKLKSIETSRYFSCENCGRKIAGGRFAQHINKCLERKRK